MEQTDTNTTMFRCEQLSRVFTDPNLVFWVEHPHFGPLVSCFVGRDMVDLNVPDEPRYRKSTPLEADEGGVNLYAALVGASGEPKKGEFQFSIGFTVLRNYLPGVYMVYYTR